MSHALNKMWIHAVWTTKWRLPLIHSRVENKIHKFIAEQLKEQDCPVRIINGMPDHIHCLFLLNPNKKISDVIKQVKGSSSRFINTNNLLPEKFAWQIGYATFSVSESGLDNVFNYIKRQKQHHRKKTFQQEKDDIMQLINS